MIDYLKSQIATHKVFCTSKQAKKKQQHSDWPSIGSTRCSSLACEFCSSNLLQVSLTPQCADIWPPCWSAASRKLPFVSSWGGGAARSSTLTQLNVLTSPLVAAAAAAWPSWAGGQIKPTLGCTQPSRETNAEWKIHRDRRIGSPGRGRCPLLTFLLGTRRISSEQVVAVCPHWPLRLRQMHCLGENKQRKKTNNQTEDGMSHLAAGTVGAWPPSQRAVVRTLS